MTIRLLVCLSVTMLAGIARAEKSRPLLRDGDDAVTFQLKDQYGKTTRLILFDAPD